jgi:polysaccharide export outer membrane protein
LFLFFKTLAKRQLAESKNISSRIFNGISLPIAIIGFVLFFSSCNLKNKYVYLFNNPKGSEIIQHVEPVIQKGDRLEIKIAGLEPESSLPFYFSTGTGTQAIANIENPSNVFLVNEDGEIDMPVIGKIKLQGLNIRDAEFAVKSKLQNIIRVPVVQVRIFNYMVAVLGEVKMPGYYKVPNNRINILELIAMAGDVTLNANRNEVMLIRQTGEGEKTIFIDLTSGSVFSSPGFNLRQNDIVYVRPNKSGLLQPTLLRSTGPIALSALSVILTMMVFFIR